MPSKKCILLICLGLGMGCSPMLYMPTEADTKAGVTLSELNEGRVLFVKNCGSCHTLHLPQKFTKEVWIENLEEMAAKAKITKQEKDLILRYLMNSPDLSSGDRARMDPQ